MNCPVCHAENKEGSSLCHACGARLGPRPAGKASRNRRRDPQGPLSPETEARHRAARTAYRVAVLGLVPGLGLVFGPVAVGLGVLARQRGLKDLEFTLWGPVFAAIIFGAIEGVFNWAGFTLMFLGLRSTGWL
jgi:hypothetical protein